MARYTDIDKLIAEYDRVHVGPPGGARKLMEDAPIADVVEVVRCKDCLHYMELEGCDYKGKKARHCFCHSQLRREIDYCSDGIRKGGEKMRERLIEIFNQADEKAFEYIRENDHMDFIPTKDEIAGVYADHLFANGVIVPPCKVGDTVWCIDGFCDESFEVVERIIVSFTIFKNSIHFYAKKPTHRGWARTYGVDDFGKTVFLTREEAEAALKGR